MQLANACTEDDAHWANLRRTKLHPEYETGYKHVYVDTACLCATQIICARFATFNFPNCRVPLSLKFYLKEKLFQK